MATTTASLSTGSFDVIVKDLNAADGVTAGLTWDANWSLYGSSGYALQTGYALVSYSWGNSLEARWGVQSNDWDNASAPTTLLAGAAQGGVGSYSISLDGSGRPTASVQLTVEEGSNAYVSAQFSRGFWLTAGTQVSFSLLADSALSGSAYTGSWTPPAGVNSYPGHSSASSALGMSVGQQSASLYLSGSNGFCVLAGRL